MHDSSCGRAATGCHPASRPKAAQEEIRGPHAMRLMGVALYPTQLWQNALPRILIFPLFQSSCKDSRGQFLLKTFPFLLRYISVVEI